MLYRRERDSCVQGCVKLLGGNIDFFEAPKETRLLLNVSEIRGDPEIKGSAVSSLKLCTYCCDGIEFKEME